MTNDDNDLDDLYAQYLSRLDAFSDADQRMRWAEQDEARAAMRQAMASYKTYRARVDAFEAATAADDVLIELRSKLLTAVSIVEARHQRAKEQRGGDALSTELVPADEETEGWMRRLFKRGKN